MASFRGEDPGGILPRTGPVGRDYLFSPSYGKPATELYDQALREAAAFAREDPPVNRHYKEFLLALRSRVESFYRAQIGGINTHYKNLMSPRFQSGLLKECFHLPPSLRATLEEERKRTLLVMRIRHERIIRSTDSAPDAPVGVIDRLIIERTDFFPADLVLVFRELSYLCFLPNNLRTW